MENRNDQPNRQPERTTDSDLGSFEQASAILATLSTKCYLFRAELALKQAISDSSSPVEGGSGTAPTIDDSIPAP